LRTRNLTQRHRSFERPPLYAEYERMREDGSVVWDTGQRVWLVLGFDECDAVLRNEEVFAHPNRRDLVSDEAWDDLVSSIGGERALVLLGNEQHARLHREITQRFAHNIADYRRERIRPVIERFMDGFVEGGTGEFVDDFAHPAPAAVIASILGLAWDDPALLTQWKAWDAATLQTRNRFDITAEEYAAGREAARQLDAVLRPVVRARKTSPQDDFISQLWACAPEILPDRTEDDIVAQCRQLFQAGSQTTTHVMTNAAVLLFGRSDLWGRLKSNPGVVDRFVEETIRILGVFQLDRA
jgi:cytochrome P450